MFAFSGLLRLLGIALLAIFLTFGPLSPVLAASLYSHGAGSHPSDAEKPLLLAKGGGGGGGPR